MKTSINAAKVISYFLVASAFLVLVAGILSAEPGNTDSALYVWIGLAGFLFLIAIASVLSMVAGIAKSTISMAGDIKEMSEAFKALNQRRVSSASKPPAQASPRV